MDPQRERELNKPGGITDRLRRLRDASRLNQGQLAEQLGWPRTKVSKLETGKQPPSRDDITAWTQACNDPAAADELLHMLEELVAVHRPYRHTRRNSSHAEIQGSFDQTVQGGKRIRNFEVSLIPGLLQTPEYIRWRSAEVNEVYGFTDDPDAVVTARMRRQEVLYDAGHEFEFVITELSLGLATAPPSVMVGQINRLIATAGLGNVTFGIIPSYTVAKLPVAPMHGFLTVDDVTFLETHSALDDLPPRESTEYDRFMDSFLAEALTGDDAERLLMESYTRWRSIAAGE